MEENPETKERLDLKKVSKRESRILSSLNRMAVGQEFAKKSIATCFLNKDNGLRRVISGEKPPATLLFIGPIGSGKTHLIKSFSTLMFGDENAFVRVNCTLFHEGMITQQKIDDHGFRLDAMLQSEAAMNKAQAELDILDAKKLEIESNFRKNVSEGANHEQAILTRDREIKKIQKKQEDVIAKYEKFVKEIKWLPGGNYPAIVVFEGIDEMHPGVVNILKEIMDSGMFTNANGDVVSFRNCFIFLTCNLMSEDLANEFSKKGTMGYNTDKHEYTTEKLYALATKKIMKTLPLELLKGIGKENIIVFRPFSKAEMLEIISRKLDLLRKIKLGDDSLNIYVSFSDNVKEYIYSETRDSVNEILGASSIDRIISLRICNKISKLIGSGEYKINPGDTIMVDVEKKELVFFKTERVVV